MTASTLPSPTPSPTPTDEAATAGSLGWRDPWALLACLVALPVYLLHGFDGALSRDLGVYSYAGQTVADGVPPYEGILNRAGPLAHLVPGIGAFVARAVGMDELMGMRLLFLLLTLACVAVSYLLGRDLFRSRVAGLAAAAALMCSHAIVTYATYGPREKTTMLLFLLCALLAMTHQRWAWTGVFIALGTLTWQPVFFAVIAGAVVAILLGERTGRPRALGALVVGGLIPSALTVGAYAAIGHLQLFFDDFLLINARYTEQISPLGYPGEIWRILVTGYGWTLWVLFLGIAAVLVLAGRAAVTRTWRRDPVDAALVGVGVAVIAGILWSLRAFNGWPDAFIVLPQSVVGIGGLAAAIARRVSARTALAVTLAWVTAATAATVAYSIGAKDTGLIGQKADVATVMGLLPADATMLSVEAPQPLVLADRRNLSRYQLLGNGLIDYLDDTWPGGSDGYGRWVGARKPTVIALGLKLPPEWLAPVLAADYRRVGTSTGWNWYIRTDVPRATREQMRAGIQASK